MRRYTNLYVYLYIYLILYLNVTLCHLFGVIPPLILIYLVG